MIKGLLLVTVLVQAARGQAGEDRLLGELSELTHEVKGTVYARGDRTLVIKNFYYDGLGPQGFFFVGTEGKPLQGGRLVPYPQGNNTILLSDPVLVADPLNDLNTSAERAVFITCLPK